MDYAVLTSLFPCSTYPRYVLFLYPISSPHSVDLVGEEEEIERLTGYGREIGLAFQVIDDVLDVEGDATSLGKSAGKDQKAWTVRGCQPSDR